MRSKFKKILMGLCISVFLLTFGGSTVVASEMPVLKWDNLVGGSAVDQFKTVIATSDGGYIAVGFSRSSGDGEITDINNQNGDGLIVKFDSTGNTEWDNLVGGLGHDSLMSIIETSDGGFIAVGFATSSASGEITDTNSGGYDGLIVKLDSDGNVDWTKLYGGSNNDYFSSIKITSDGGYILSGYSSSSANGDISNISSGGYDGLIVKFDNNWNQEWDKLIGGTGYDNFDLAIETSDGGFVVAGYTASGEINDTSNGGYDGLIVKLDGSGNIEWNDLFGGTGNDYFSSVIESSGGYLVVGRSDSSGTGDITDTSNGSTDGLIVKFDTSGNIEWDNLVGGTGIEHFVDIVESSGGYLVAGRSDSSGTGDITDTSNGITDGLIVKFDTSGNILWDKLVGGAGVDNFSSLYETSDGGCVIVGISNSSVSGYITDVNNGGSDGVIIKLKFSYEVLFDINGGTSQTPDSQQIEEGNYITSPIDPTMDGYTFLGWNTVVDGSGTMWDFTSDVMPGDDLILYAQWEEIKYTVTYDSNGGSSVDSEMLPPESLVTKPTDPTRDGYTFLGWNTASDGSGFMWDFTSDVMPADDLTLYAQWEENETIDNGNGIDKGKVTDIEKTTDGSDASIPPKTGENMSMFAALLLLIIGALMITGLRTYKQK